MTFIFKEMLGNIIECYVDDFFVGMRQKKRITWNTPSVGRQDQEASIKDEPAQMHF